jgi:hypothetical protein
LQNLALLSNFNKCFTPKQFESLLNNACTLEENDFGKMITKAAAHEMAIAKIQNKPKIM